MATLCAREACKHLHIACHIPCNIKELCHRIGAYHRLMLQRALINAQLHICLLFEQRGVCLFSCGKTRHTAIGVFKHLFKITFISPIYLHTADSNPFLFNEYVIMWRPRSPSRGWFNNMRRYTVISIRGRRKLLGLCEGANRDITLAGTWQGIQCMRYR